MPQLNETSLSQSLASFVLSLGVMMMMKGLITSSAYAVEMKNSLLIHHNSLNIMM